MYQLISIIKTSNLLTFGVEYGIASPVFWISFLVIENKYFKIVSEGIAMADLGYPRSGGGDVPTPVVRREGQYIIWQNVCRKMHENETNWTELGVERCAPSVPPPLYPPMDRTVTRYPRKKILASFHYLVAFFCFTLNIYETKNNELEALETLRQNIFSLDNPVWCNVQVIDSFTFGTYKKVIRWIIETLNICSVI